MKPVSPIDARYYSGDFSYMYDFMMKYETFSNPNMLHLTSTVDYHTYFRYFLQRVMSLFIFDGLPQTWDENYMKIVLFLSGKVGVVSPPELGVIPQQCTPYGYNIYYRPTNIIISNPAFPSTIKNDYIIGKDCEMILMSPDWLGVADLINAYAQRMALILSSGDVASALSKIGYVFFADDKATAESYKVAFDDIQSGKLAVVTSKKMLDGFKSHDVLSGDISTKMDTLIKAYDTAMKLQSDFDKEVGIYAPSDKKERLVLDEVAQARETAFSRCELWLDCINKSLTKVNSMFGTDITCRLRLRGGTGDAENDPTILSV